MVERTTGIRPLHDESVKYNLLLLKNSRIVEGEGRYFGELGTFTLEPIELRSLSEIPPTIAMWTQKLLDYDPKECKLSIYQGQVIVSKLDNTVLKSIPPRDIRRIDVVDSEMGIVRKSGYVLANHFYSVGQRGGINVEEFERILESVDDGQEPLGFSPYRRVKVDPTLVGRKLWVCIFEPDFRPIWYRDAVVIDPETRKLVDRKILY